MNFIERWFLKRLLRKLVRQDFFHRQRITGVYQMVRDAYEAEFTEDNAITADVNLREWFENTQALPLPLDSQPGLRNARGLPPKASLAQ
ncbi:hypothetical protein D3C71_18690 [compost metagenome]